MRVQCEGGAVVNFVEQRDAAEEDEKADADTDTDGEDAKDEDDAHDDDDEFRKPDDWDEATQGEWKPPSHSKGEKDNI